MKTSPIYNYYSNKTPIENYAKTEPISLNHGIRAWASDVLPDPPNRGWYPSSFASENFPFHSGRCPWPVLKLRHTVHVSHKAVHLSTCDLILNQLWLWQSLPLKDTYITVWPYNGGYPILRQIIFFWGSHGYNTLIAYN